MEPSGVCLKCVFFEYQRRLQPFVIVISHKVLLILLQDAESVHEVAV